MGKGQHGFRPTVKRTTQPQPAKKRTLVENTSAPKAGAIDLDLLISEVAAVDSLPSPLPCDVLPMEFSTMEADQFLHLLDRVEEEMEL